VAPAWEASTSTSRRTSAAAPAADKRRHGPTEDAAVDANSSAVSSAWAWEAALGDRVPPSAQPVQPPPAQDTAHAHDGGVATSRRNSGITTGETSRDLGERTVPLKELPAEVATRAASVCVDLVSPANAKDAAPAVHAFPMLFHYRNGDRPGYDAE
jgi:hypothetical protein